MLIYFAAPLFSAAELHFNRQLTAKLESLGYRVFLPQRDGVEKHQPPYDSMGQEERRWAMFERDKAGILEADIFLFILDGRVPDEGACVELGIAYCSKELGANNKLIIGLHTDTRAAFLHAKLNPMLRGTLEFIAADTESLLQMLEDYKRGTLHE